MSVLNRPMFRQAGGPAEPMPQDMGPEAAMLQEAEAGAMSRGQEIGAQYAQDMMQGIDQAQSTEDLINALRGNDKSLEARRSELAGFVGQDDANQTPESVLAMVQPVVMMTEEGMMDSGIGALVQGLVGDVEMTTASGAPTDMGMGVGSLMAAGAQEAPAPQNFRQGGEVAYLDKGSSMTATAPAMSLNPLGFASENVMSFGDTVKGRYEELLPLYQEILGADQESKDATKAQMLFDVAQGGLQLAAGVPGAGSSFVSQLAGAAAPVAGRIQERGAALEQERRGIKQGALGTAMQQAQSEQDFNRDLRKAEAVARIQASAKQGTIKPDERIVLDRAGNEIAVVNVLSGTGALDYDNYQAANAAAAKAGELAPYQFRKMGSGTTSLTNYTIQRPDATTGMLSTNMVESFDGGRTYIDEKGTAVPFPTGPGVSVAEVPPETATSTQRSLGSASRYQKILAKHLAGVNTAGMEAITNNSVNSALISTFVSNPERMVGPDGQPIETDMSEIDTVLNEARAFAYEAALNGTGPANMIRSGLQAGFGFMQDGMDADDALREQQRTLMRAIRFVGKTALISNSRLPVAESVLAAELFPDPDKFLTDPDVEAQKFQVIAQITDSLYTHNLRELASGQLNPTQRAEAENSLRQVSFLRSLLGYVPKFSQEDLGAPDRFSGYENRIQTLGGNTGIE